VKLGAAEAGVADKVKVYSADVSTADIQEIREPGSSWVATSATNPAVVGEVSGFFNEWSGPFGGRSAARWESGREDSLPNATIPAQARRPGQTYESSRSMAEEAYGHAG
jgi:hypothetical protein